MEEDKVNYFLFLTILYRQANHKVLVLVQAAKCQSYTEVVALASSSKELQQIVKYTLK